MSQFRWTTTALSGTWYGTQIEALEEALKFGQAVPALQHGDPITLHQYALIETRPFA